VAGTPDMRKIVVILLLFTAVVAAVLLYFMLGKPAPKAASLLPESTLLFLDVPDFSQARDDFAKTELYALWHEPEVQAFLEKPLAAVQGMAADLGAPREANGLGNQILNAMQGEAFFAVTHVTIFPAFSPGLVLGVDARHKRMEATAALYALENNLKRSYPKGRFQDKKHLGVKYSVWEPQPGVQVCHAWLNSLVVFTLGEDALRDVIACYVGQPPRDFKPLAASAKYENVLGHAPKHNEFLAYLNTEELLNLLGPLLALAPQTSRMFENLARIQTSASSMAFLDGGIEDVGFVGYSKPEAKPTPPTRRKTLALTSPDTLVYCVRSADLAALYDDAMQSLSQSGSASVMPALTQFEQALSNRGIHIREDVLQKFGPELALMAHWPSGAPAPTLAVVSEIADASAIRPAVDGVMDALKEATLGDDTRFPWDETEYAGLKLRTVHIGGPVLAPTYATTDQFFILASTPDGARELLARTKEAGPTLTKSELYTRSMMRLPTNGSSYVYANLRGLFEPLYVQGTPGLSRLGTNDFLDLTKLPRSETIAKHLFPLVSATVSEPQQTTTISFSPFGKPLLLATGIGATLWVGNTFAPTLQQYINPAVSTKPSGTAARSAPRENQTATSQTLPTR